MPFAGCTGFGSGREGFDLLGYFMHHGGYLPMRILHGRDHLLDQP
jgi:hypothetical protein